MRISVDKRDPGYKHYASIFRVKFNGEEVSDVVTADEEKGFITRYKRDAEGKLVVAPDMQHWVLETVEGKVEVWAVNERGENVRLPKVKVERNTSGYIEVLVYSQMKQGRIRRTTLDEKTREARKWSSVEAAVGICAGAAAEHLCADVGDLFEPSDVAALAIEEYKALMKLEATRH